MTITSRSLPLLALLLALAAGPAHAQDVANEADLLFRRGGELFKAGKYSDALLDFLASNRLVRNRNALYNVASCYLKLGQYSDAFRFFSEYQREPLAEVERLAVAREVDKLRTRVALLAVSSTPAGGLVYIDRRDLGSRGATPGLFALTPGRHTLIVEVAGHHAEERAVELVVGKTVEVKLLPRLVLGSVELRVRPPGAMVRVDRDHGPADALAPATLRLAPGRHALYLSRAGYRSARSEVEVRAAQLVRVEAALDQLPPTPARLVINSNRRGALVSVDGQAVGAAPVTVEVAPGPRRVEVSDDDFAPFRAEVQLAPGERRVVNAQLLIASEAEVAAATKMVQTVEEAPSSITVLVGEEVRALGYRTLGEALRGVRGFYLSDDRQYQTIGVRGFGPPGDFNTRLLLLSDGHSLNDVWTGATFIGHDFAATLDDVEKIEVVRGPGSALYGTGAFFAVVDVTSRQREDQRVSLSLGGGTLGEVLGHGSLFQQLGERASLRLSAGVLYSPRGTSFADGAGGTVSDNDGETAASAQARVAVGDFTFSGRYNERKKTLPTTVFEITPGTGRAFTQDRRAYFEGRFERALRPTVNLMVRATYDHTRYHGRWPYSASAEDDLRDDGAADWLGAEARVVGRPSSWLNLVAGAEGLYAPSVSQSAQSGSEAVSSESSLGSASGYVFAEVRLPRQLRLFAGFRGDYLTLAQTFSPSPNVALVWRPYAQGILKFLFGRAFRAPSFYELTYSDGGVSQVPSANLGPETLYTWQLEHTHAFGRRLYLTGSVYYNDVRGLINLGAAAAGTSGCQAAEGCVQYQNLGHVGTLGAELELRRSFGPGGSFSLAYAFQRTRDLDAGPFTGEGARRVVNSPEHLAYGRLVRPLVRELLVLGAELIYGSPRMRRDGTDSSHMLLANLTLSGRVRRASLRYALSLYNLFDWRYATPVGSEYAATQLEVQQLGRTLLGTLGASF